MNTQTKKTFKLNFFDILLIVLAVLIIGAAAALIIHSSGSRSGNHTTIEYTVLVKELPDEMQIHATPGQTVIDTIRLGVIGEVVSYKKMPAMYDAFDRTTESTVHAQYDDVFNVEFTFRAEADKTESSYMINNVRVSVGAEVHFRTPYFVNYGYVTEVREIPEA